MHPDRFFESARGKIVAALRARGGASATDLAREFGLSTNAIRQQLVILERDGLVEGRSVRRGKTKPTVEFRLTSAADELFPQQYDRMLNAVLREIRTGGGDEAVAAVFASMSRRQAERLNAKVGDAPVGERVDALMTMLRTRGVEADAEPTAAGYVIHERNCPYAKTVGEHPELCSVIHGVIADVVAPAVTQTESLATGGNACRFEITTQTAAPLTASGPARTGE